MVRVRDTGEGIPVEHLHRVFDPFFQVPRTPRRPVRGAGLGLAVCRQIAGLHGGDIRAESGGSGTGTVIVLTLPLRSAGSSG